MKRSLLSIVLALGLILDAGMRTPASAQFQGGTGGKAGVSIVPSSGGGGTLGGSYIPFTSGGCLQQFTDGTLQGTDLALVTPCDSTTSTSIILNKQTSGTIGENGVFSIWMGAAGLFGNVGQLNDILLFSQNDSTGWFFRTKTGTTFDAKGHTPLTIWPGAVRTGTLNTAAYNLVLAGGQSTGNAAGGEVVFQTAPLGGSGTTQNALLNRWHIGANGGLYSESSADKGSATIATKAYYLDQTLMFAGAAPSVSSGFGTSPAMVSTNGSAAFELNVGTGGTATSGVLSAGNTASHGWRASCDDITTQSATVFVTKQIATTTTTVTLANFNTSGVQAAWAASDHLVCSLVGY